MTTHYRTLAALVLLSPLVARGDTVTPSLPDSGKQAWTGAALWANPMEDWHTEVTDGTPAATCDHPGGDRELVVLTAEITDKKAPLELSATFRTTRAPAGNAKGFIGFQIGLQGQFDDYRDSAIYGTGFAAGIKADGRLFIGGMTAGQAAVQSFDRALDMKLSATPAADGTYTLTLTAGDARFSHPGVHASWLPGLASYTVSTQAPAMTSLRRPRPQNAPGIRQNRGGKWLAAISGMSLSGDKITARPERSFGPIYWTQHTLEHSGKLNLTAQLAPVSPTRPEVSLSIDGKTSTVRFDPRSRVASFRLDGIDTTREHPYTVTWQGHSYSGTIRKEPLEKPDLTVAALSCNDSTGFPHNLLVDNVRQHQPDLLAFMGDQIYEPIGGYGLLFGENNTQYDDRTVLCYLRKYAMHGWAWRELLRDTPAFALPDDHDVFHGNLWGAGGKLADRSGGIYAEAQDSGGYKMSVGFVNAVHQTQTGSLPKPVDPAPTATGISVYFTNWKYAGIDLAILADRQFKSAPKALLPDSKIRNGWPQNFDFQRPALKNPRVLDHPQAELLGKRQEAFLETWATGKDKRSDWSLVISATPLMTLQSIPEDKFSDGVVPSLKRPRPGDYPANDIPKLDYDSNGWPQGKRDLAVDLITRAHAVHVTGDQHLGSTGQYGTDRFNNSAWWISSPAIANLWPRRWFPRDGGANRREGDPKYTGEFEDGFGNKMTLHAASNPYDIDREPSRLYDKAVGYSILTLHRGDGSITLANWPYYSGPENKVDNQPYPGWPITIDPKTNKRIK
ncbi:MAG: alkaline phosphatase D family protein [Akkermansiaceae bacterium]|nr:alkaline phosphatase D family protein [Akkermansiaceae bacterium]